jgi:hypothetical protein
MNSERFDSLARRLAARVSRRSILGAGAAVALGASTRPNTRIAAAQVAEETTAVDRYIAVRTFSYDSTREKAEAELPDLVAHMEEQPGFVSIACVWGETEIYLVVTFLDEATAVPGMETIDWWIETHIQSTLYGDYQESGGKVFSRSRLMAGCPCDLEDEDDPCGSDLLVCCPSPEGESEFGVCLTAETTCPGVGGESEDPSDEDLTLSPDDMTPTPEALSNCTSQGCACPDGTCDAGLTCCGSTGTCEPSCPCGSVGCHCIGSVINTCDEGLVCCAPGEIGGEGTCQYECTCSYEGCACTTGATDACDVGLVCCGIFSSDPGNIGVCLSSCSPTSNPCPGGEGCECIPNTMWTCNGGLVCCGATDSGESGICQSTCSTSVTPDPDIVEDPVIPEESPTP